MFKTTEHTTYIELQYNHPSKNKHIFYLVLLQYKCFLYDETISNGPDKTQA